METKEAHLANLINMAKADGVLHPIESLFIQGIAMKMGIAQGSFSRIAAMPDLASKKMSEDAETRIRQFCEIIILTQIDLMQHDEERKLLYEIGMRMKIPARKVDSLVEYLSKHKLPDNVISLMEVI
jgi:uncharacterized tellurite resistance protein B-like protein